MQFFLEFFAGFLDSEEYYELTDCELDIFHVSVNLFKVYSGYVFSFLVKNTVLVEILHKLGILLQKCTEISVKSFQKIEIFYHISSSSSDIFSTQVTLELRIGLVHTHSIKHLIIVLFDDFYHLIKLLKRFFLLVFEDIVLQIEAFLELFKLYVLEFVDCGLVFVERGLVEAGESDEFELFVEVLDGLLFHLFGGFFVVFEHFDPFEHFSDHFFHVHVTGILGFFQFYEVLLLVFGGFAEQRVVKLIKLQLF